MERIRNDAVIIERNVYAKTEELEQIRQAVIDQIADGGVAILPVGFSAKVITRDVLLWDGCDNCNDPEEVVHCKDCIEWQSEYNMEHGVHYCPLMDAPTEANDYCSYGERREDGN